jgi:dolichol-phosphate mannosyltransferase
MTAHELDIVVPVYHEAANVTRMLNAFEKWIQTSFRVLLCYDSEDDDTLPVARAYRPERFEIAFVKNAGQGPLGAVVTGLEATTAPAVLIWPADDDYNARRINALMHAFRSGCDVVSASRFSPGGRTSGYPFGKAVLVRCAGLALYHAVGLPTRDPTNGLRLFSARAAHLPIETTEGHAYSLELLVKSHRRGWRIGEVPVEWHERSHGKSRFRLLKWLPSYARWFGYALATRYTAHEIA